MVARSAVLVLALRMPTLLPWLDMVLVLPSLLSWLLLMLLPPFYVQGYPTGFVGFAGWKKAPALLGFH